MFFFEGHYSLNAAKGNCIKFPGSKCYLYFRVPGLMKVVLDMIISPRLVGLGDEILPSYIPGLFHKPWNKDPYQPISIRECQPRVLESRCSSDVWFQIDVKRGSVYNLLPPMDPFKDINPTNSGIKILETLLMSTLRIIGPSYRGVWMCIAGFWISKPPVLRSHDS